MDALNDVIEHLGDSFASPPSVWDNASVGGWGDSAPASDASLSNTIVADKAAQIAVVPVSSAATAAPPSGQRLAGIHAPPYQHSTFPSHVAPPPQPHMQQPSPYNSFTPLYVSGGPLPSQPVYVLPSNMGSMMPPGAMAYRSFPQHAGAAPIGQMPLTHMPMPMPMPMGQMHMQMPVGSMMSVPAMSHGPTQQVFMSPRNMRFAGMPSQWSAHGVLPVFVSNGSYAAAGAGVPLLSTSFGLH